MKVLLFGGTTEGRELSRWLASRGGVDVVAYAATEYGGSLIESGPHLESRVGRLDAGDMLALMERGGFSCVVDATHPYADLVTENIAVAAEAAGADVVRVVRDAEPAGPWTGVADAAHAAELLAGREGNILLTIGSKDLGAFVAVLPDFAKRLFVRVLPVESSIAHAHRLGIPASHIIAMQGPFSTEFNCALISELGIEVLVTKASGSAGGFWEKVEAAQECACELVVVHRPREESGYTLEQAKKVLEERYGA